MKSVIDWATETFSVSKPTNEAGGHEHAVAVDLVDALGDVALGVLLLAHLHQGLGIRALDADEDGEEVRILHRLQHLVVVGEIDRGFGRELERIVVLLQPRLEPRHQGAQVLAVADEIVVDEIDMAAIAAVVERLQLGEDLVVGLGARHAAVQLDDVAELAGERAAARILHADVEILLELQQVVARQRALRDVDLELLGREHALALAALPGGDEVRHDVLGLADHLEVGRRVEMRARRDVRAADADRLAVQVRELDQIEEVRLLVEHAADHHQVGPVEVRVGQRLGVAVDEAEVPFLRAACAATVIRPSGAAGYFAPTSSQASV